MTTDYARAVPILRKAADIIDKHGWRRGASGPGAPDCCALTALHRSAQSLGFGALTETFTAAVLDQYLTADPQPYGYDRMLDEGTFRAIVGWNDFAVDNGEVVVLALRNAATWAEGRANA
jgi:hypothetical protein